MTDGVASEENVVNLKNWYYRVSPRGCLILWGDAYDHPGFVQGAFVRTSPVEHIYPDTKQVRTYSGTLYHLDDTGDESFWEIKNFERYGNV